MWVKKVYSNKESFRNIKFGKAFNIILADKLNTSTDTDTRNGLGKSMLMSIVNFCLGSNLPAKLDKDELKDWEFFVDVEIDSKEIVLRRAVLTEGFIDIKGGVDVLSIGDDDIQPLDDDWARVRVDSFCLAMGAKLFDLRKSDSLELKYNPTYRSLISYFIRTDAEAFNNPFKFFGLQPSWSVQVNNSYLLSLDWRGVSRLLTLIKQKGVYGKLKAASKEGLVEGITGSIGELNAEEVRLELLSSNLKEKLADFKVHEQYAEIQREADELTGQIHGLLNSIALKKSILSKYEDSLELEVDINPSVVEDIYKTAGVSFSVNAIRHLNDVKQFHQQVVEDRRVYLREEIISLRDAIRHADAEIAVMSNERAGLLSILDSHGALEEYGELQMRSAKLTQSIVQVKDRISRINEFEDKLSDVKVDIEESIKSLRLDFQQRNKVLAEAIAIFNQNSQYLYSDSGVLSIEVADGGYVFNVDIKRSESDGIGNMKVFCYDLMLAELRCKYNQAPVFLFHDSKLFDGVDSRQVAKALELANSKSSSVGFQYICSINSDKVPGDDFRDGFKKVFDDATRITLTDQSTDGNLLGIEC